MHCLKRCIVQSFKIALSICDRQLFSQYTLRRTFDKYKQLLSPTFQCHAFHLHSLYPSHSPRMRVDWICIHQLYLEARLLQAPDQSPCHFRLRYLWLPTCYQRQSLPQSQPWHSAPAIIPITGLSLRQNRTKSAQIAVSGHYRRLMSPPRPPRAKGSSPNGPLCIARPQKTLQLVPKMSSCLNIY